MTEYIDSEQSKGISAVYWTACLQAWSADLAPHTYTHDVPVKRGYIDELTARKPSHYRSAKEQRYIIREHGAFTDTNGVRIVSAIVMSTALDNPRVPVQVIASRRLTPPELEPADTPPVLIMCEECGQDILKEEARWYDDGCTDGRVPLCPECAQLNSYRDQNPDD